MPIHKDEMNEDDMVSKKVISRDKLYVDSKIQFQQILELTIRHKCNCHIEASIKGIVKIGYIDFISSSYSREKISVSILDQENPISNRLIFCGVIEDVDLYKGSDYTEVSLKAKSHTYALDISEQSRSFQDIRMSYTDIMDIIANESSATYISSAPKAKISYPLLQYQESNWGFLKRIASFFGMPLIASPYSDKPQFYVGLSKRNYIGDFSNIEHIFSINENYIKFENKNSVKSFYTTYTLLLDEIYQIGDYINLNGKQLLIIGCDFSLRDGRLTCYYTFGPIEAVAVNQNYNAKIKGVSIEGTVLETKNESVKIHLHIDSSQDQSSAFYFPWYPESGNIMYCMPETGTIVSVIFSTWDESSAMVVHNVRGRQIFPEMQNPENKYFTSQHEKRMSFFPERMEFISLSVGNQMMLNENSGISFESKQTINVQAKGKVSINGQDVSVTAPKELAMANSQSTVMNLCNNIDTIGGKAQFGSTKPSSGFKGFIPTKPRYKMDELEEDILSAVPVNEDTDELSDIIRTASILL